MKKKLDYIREHNWTMLLLGILVGLIISATGIYASTLADSVNVIYSNASTTLSSTNVQDALDELYEMCSAEKIATTITNLFNDASQTSVTTAGGESITQASSVSLMEDSYGNIRYYGASPSNYVSFNDELWRIIGVFDVEDEDGNTEKRVKIVRNETIGSFAYDNKPSGYGSSDSDYGSNDWSDARLMMLLNPGYESGATDSSGNTIYAYTGSLYWNSKSGTCYSGSSSGTTSCSFTSSGLGSEAQSMIGQAKYYLGGFSSSYYAYYPDQIYEYERGTTVYSGHATNWTGYVGLIYLSDYAYATDLSVCTANLVNYYSYSSACEQNDWLYLIGKSNTSLGGSLLLTMTGSSVDSYRVMSVYSYNSISNLFTYNGSYVNPVVYLNSGVTITGGSGTSSDPYTIE